MELTLDALNRLLDLGQMMAGPRTVQGGNVPYVMAGSKAQPLPELIYNEHASRPERIKQNVSVLDPESFCEYYALFRDESSRVFAYEPDIKVVAVLDYHQEQSTEAPLPRWGSHKLTLTLRHSPEWLNWCRSNGKQFTQEEFAEFLEQNSIDITKPDPASMMEVARDLQATTEVEFGSGVRMNDGQVRFKYTETTKSSVGANQLAVPERFTMQIPVFIGGERIALDALLRFRVKEGHLAIWYTLVRPEDALRRSFLAARDSIAATLQVRIINGQAA